MDGLMDLHKSETLMYQGREYRVMGRLRGLIPVGTILGPNTLEEYVTAIDHSITDDGAFPVFGRTQLPDMVAAKENDNPRSVAEHHLLKRNH
jgi:hypothetical protein